MMPLAPPTAIDENIATTEAHKTAVIYLRVSSTGQLTGHSQEGYSIEGQREACEHHAERLGAQIIGEFVEPGRSATNLRRPALQQMLGELGNLQPTFVIFYDLSRVARDEFDAFWLKREIESNGSKLESTLERIGDDEDGMLFYTVMTGVNAHRSRRDGRKVKMGLERKFADGGTMGPARIGYMNAREWINGKEVRTIARDPERDSLVQDGFEAFATGEHSISSLRDFLEEIGLRTRPAPKRPGKPLSRNGVYRMLRDDYYIGIVTHKSVKREGRHEPLIDPAIFEKVQHTLASNRLAGDRSHKHAHYLKGSIFCGHCGGRLIYGRHKGNGGVYDYFRCLSGQRRQACGGGYLPVADVEQAIEGYYRTIQLTPSECEDIRRELKDQVGVRLETARRQSERHQRRLRDLQDEQKKLLQLFYRDGVDEDVLKAEQERIAAERTQARRWVETATHEASEASDALDEALALVENVHAVYLVAESEQRRMLNQAIFSQLLVRIDLLEGEEASVFSQIRGLGGSRTRARADVHKDQDPRLSGGLGYNMTKMVRMRGLEPPPSYLDTDLNRARLPIPPHPRDAGRRYRTGHRGVRVVSRSAERRSAMAFC